MNDKEVVEVLEKLKNIATIPKSMEALQIAINIVRKDGEFLHWLMDLNSDEFDSKKQLLNKIQLTRLLGVKDEKGDNNENNE